MSSRRTTDKNAAQQHTFDLIQRIHELVPTLPDTIPEAEKTDVIYTAMKKTAESAFATFNRRFDAFAAEDTRSKESGRLQYIRRGRLGLNAVCAYLKRVLDEPGLQYDLMDIKLERLIKELEFYQPRLAILPERWILTSVLIISQCLRR